LDEKRGVGGGSSVALSHSKASRSWNYGMTVFDLKKDRVTLELYLHYESVDDSGFTSEGSIHEKIIVLHVGNWKHQFGDRVYIKAYYSR